MKLTTTPSSPPQDQTNEMKLKSICFVLENYYPNIGGVEESFQRLAEHLAAAGAKVRVVTTRLPQTKPVEQINQVDIRRVWTPRPGKRYFFSLVAFFHLLTLAREYELMHTTTFNAALPAWLAARVLKKKILITINEVWGQLWFRLPGLNPLSALGHYLYERLIMKLLYDQYICISEYTRKSVQNFGVKSGRVKVIYNGLNEEFWNPKKYDPVENRRLRKKLNLGNRFTYLFFGRPGISKGVEYLLQAVPEVSQKIPNSQLLLILAKQPARGYHRVLKLIKQVNISDHVKIVPPVAKKELPSYILMSDCVVVPSLSEGFGFSAVEACYLGTPLVATRVGALPEVVGGKYQLVEARSPSALAQAIYRVSLREYREEPVKRFPLVQTVQQYLSAYEKLI